MSVIANWNNAKFVPLMFEDEKDPLVREKKLDLETPVKALKRQATHEIWP